VTVTQLERNVQDNVVRNFALQFGSVSETLTIDRSGMNINSTDATMWIARSLLERVGLSPHQRFRLVGGGLSNFHDPDDLSAQPALFD